MSDEKEISVVIPVYNAASCIKKLIGEVHATLAAQQVPFEIIVVDDNSRDNSWGIIKETCSQLSNAKAFLLARNFGQHKATLCGFHNCSGKYIITIDDDFEHEPKDIFKIYNQLKESNGDVVYAMPANIKKSFARRMTARFYKFISKVENPHGGVGSSFRALKKDLVEKIIAHQNHLFFIDELILWYTINIQVCSVNFNASQKDASGYGYSKLFFLSTSVLMMSTTLPLKLVKAIGVSMSTVSFLIGAFYFFKKIIFKSPAGYTSIIVSVLFSTGLILLCLGIIGEYLGNVLMMQSNKPAFYVKERYDR